MGNVKIVSCNPENAHICASAARISTTQGDAFEIYSKSADADKDSKLIEKVLRSGHESCVEHAVFTLAFSDVSVFAEQFIIEFRLASFTVKSRRYVDFENAGYYTPAGLGSEAEKIYSEHIHYLFRTYGRLLRHGVPKEDARFVLPYCFYSNFYCTVNARELCRMICSMLYGRGSRSAELFDIGKQLLTQLESLLPSAVERLIGEKAASYYDDTASKFEVRTFESVRSQTNLLFTSDNPVERIKTAYYFAHGRFDSLTDDEIINRIFESKRPRELEHISYTFEIRNISLSTLTHIVRHRIQSLAIPTVESAVGGSYILPQSVVEYKQKEIYETAFAKTRDIIKDLSQQGIGGTNAAYLALSGNTLDIMLTMNARELMLFFKLRTCERAQWEVRGVANDMLTLLTHESAQIFSHMGASCYVEGSCPEGALSCGKPRTRKNQ